MMRNCEKKQKKNGRRLCNDPKEDAWEGVWRREDECGELMVARVGSHPISRLRSKSILHYS